MHERGLLDSFAEAVNGAFNFRPRDALAKITPPKSLVSGALYKAYSVYRWSNTVSEYLQGAARKAIKGGFTPIVVRGPKNSVLLHPSD
jgi:hypothetical protein